MSSHPHPHSAVHHTKEENGFKKENKTQNLNGDVSIERKRQEFSIYPGYSFVYPGTTIILF
jgi:hypothetical protein